MPGIKKSIFIVGCLLLCGISSVITYFTLSSIGALTSEPISLEFTVENQYVTYDGAYHQGNGYSFNMSDLLDGNYAVATYSGGGQDVGTYDISMSVQIVDAEGVDVSSQYAIKVNSGTLNVSPRTIVASLTNDALVYGDNADVSEDVLVDTEKGDELIKGHKIVPVVSYDEEAQCYASEPYVYDAVGNDVTGNYTIEWKSSYITYSKRPLTIIPTDVEKTFDNKKCNTTSYIITSGSLANGDILNADCTTEFINVDDSGEYAFNSVSIMNSYGQDVTSYYDLDYQGTATVTINPLPVYVVGKSASYTYDGTEKSISSGNPVSVYADADCGFDATDVQLTYSDTSKITKVGSVINEIAEVNVSGVDNSNYLFNKINGSITVTRATLVLTGNSREQVFDGSVFTYGEIGETYTQNDLQGYSGLASTDTVYFEYDGSIDYVGSVTNKITDVKIKNDNDEDVTSSYNVICTDGKLTLVQGVVSLTLKDLDASYGDGVDLDEIQNADDIIVENSIQGLPSGYKLKLDSDGLNSLKNRLANLTNVGDYEYTADFVITKDNKVISDTFQINVTKGTVHVTPAELTIILGGDSEQNATYTKEYDGSEYSMTTQDFSYSLKENDKIESIETAVDTRSVNGYTGHLVSIDIINEKTLEDVSSNYTLNVINPTFEVKYETRTGITINMDSITHVYDGTAVAVTDYTYGDNSKELVKGDTIIFTPSKDIVTVSQSTSYSVINSNSYTCIKYKIVNSDGEDVTKLYNITFSNLSVSITPAELVLTAASKEEVDTGKELTYGETGTIYTKDDLAGCEGLLSLDTLSFEYTGSQSGVGSTENKISNVKITASNGTDITSCYTITAKPGTLTLVKGIIKVTLKDLGTFTYGDEDEKFKNAIGALNVTGDVIDENSLEGLPSGYTLELKDVAALKTNLSGFVNAGDYEYSANFSLKDENGTVISTYKIEVTKGTVHIAPKTLTIELQSYSQEYDGQTDVIAADPKTITGLLDTDLLTSIETAVDSFGFDSAKKQYYYIGHVVSLRITSTTSFDDVTSNYAVTIKNSSFTKYLNPREVTLQMDEIDKVYDGKSIEVTDCHYASGSKYLANGDTIVFTPSEDITEVSQSKTYEVLSEKGSDTCIIYQILNSNGEDVTAFYKMNFGTGVVVNITKAPVSLQLMTYTKEYDGEVLSVSGQSDRISYCSDTSLKSELLKCSVIYLNDVKETETANVGTYYYELNTDGNSNLENYSFSYEYGYGEVIVTKRTLTVTAKSKSKDYDGTALTFEDDHEPENSVGLVSGHSISVDYSGSITDYSEDGEENVITSVSVTSGETDVTSNYDIVCISGLLTINRKVLKIKLANTTVTVDYTGEDYVIQSSDLDSSDLVEGHVFKDIQAEWITSGKTRIGKITGLSVYDSNGKDVTSLYQISGFGEKLTVNFKTVSKKLSYTINSVSMTYYEGLTDELDEEYLTKSLVQVDYSSLGISDTVADLGVDYEEYSEEYTPGSSKGSIYQVSANPTIRNTLFNMDVTAFYDIDSEVHGNIYITPVTVSVSLRNYSYVLVDDQSEIDSLDMNGPDDVIINYNSLPEDLADDIEIDFDAVETEKAGTWQYYATCEDSQYYEIQCTGGLVTLSRKSVSVQLKTYIFTYNETDTYDSFSINDCIVCSDSAVKNLLEINADLVYPDYNGAGTYSYSLDYDPTDDDEFSKYSISIEPGMVIVNPKTINVALKDYVSTYSDSGFELNDVSDAIIYCSDSVVESDLVFLSGFSMDTFQDVGTYSYTLTYDAADFENYNLVISSGNVTISPISVTVILKNFTPVAYDGLDHTIDLSDAVSYSSNLTASGQLLSYSDLSEDTFTDVGTYTYTLEYDKNEDDLKNYDFSIISGTYTIAKKDVIVSLDSETYAYGQTGSITNTTAIVSCSDSEVAYLLMGEDLTTVGTDAGTYTYSYDYNPSSPEYANYNITVVPGTITITKKDVTVTLDSETYSYGETGSITAANAILDCSEPAVESALSGETLTVIGSEVGTYSYTYNFDSSDTDYKNYNITIIPGTITITKKDVVVTLDSETYSYGETGNITAANAIVSCSDSNVAASLTGEDLTAIGTDVGTYTYSYDFDPSSSDYKNYNITIVSGTITITKKDVMVTLDSESYAYGEIGSITAANAIVSCSDSNVAASLTGEDLTAIGTNVGTYTYSYDFDPSSSDYKNYNITILSGTITITKKEVRVVLNNYSYKVADGLSITAADAIASCSDSALLTELGAEDLTQTVFTQAGTYSYSLDFDPSAYPNYSITVTSGTLTVTE